MPKLPLSRAQEIRRKLVDLDQEQVQLEAAREEAKERMVQLQEEAVRKGVPPEEMPTASAPAKPAAAPAPAAAPGSPASGPDPVAEAARAEFASHFKKGVEKDAPKEKQEPGAVRLWGRAVKERAGQELWNLDGGWRPLFGGVKNWWQGSKIVAPAAKGTAKLAGNVLLSPFKLAKWLWKNTVGEGSHNEKARQGREADEAAKTTATEAAVEEVSAREQERLAELKEQVAALLEQLRAVVDEIRQCESRLQEIAQERAGLEAELAQEGEEIAAGPVAPRPETAAEAAKRRTAFQRIKENQVVVLPVAEANRLTELGMGVADPNFDGSAGAVRMKAVFDPDTGEWAVAKPLKEVLSESAKELTRRQSYALELTNSGVLFVPAADVARFRELPGLVLAAGPEPENDYVPKGSVRLLAVQHPDTGKWITQKPEIKEKLAAANAPAPAPKPDVLHPPHAEDKAIKAKQKTADTIGQADLDAHKGDKLKAIAGVLLEGRDGVIEQRELADHVTLFPYHYALDPTYKGTGVRVVAVTDPRRVDSKLTSVFGPVRQDPIFNRQASAAVQKSALKAQKAAQLSQVRELVCQSLQRGEDFDLRDPASNVVGTIRSNPADFLLDPTDKGPGVRVVAALSNRPEDRGQFIQNRHASKEVLQMAAVRAAEIREMAAQDATANVEQFQRYAAGELLAGRDLVVSGASAEAVSKMTDYTFEPLPAAGPDEPLRVRVLSVRNPEKTGEYITNTAPAASPQPSGAGADILPFPTAAGKSTVSVEDYVLDGPGGTAEPQQTA